MNQEQPAGRAGLPTAEQAGGPNAREGNARRTVVTAEDFAAHRAKLEAARMAMMRRSIALRRRQKMQHYLRLLGALLAVLLAVLMIVSGIYFLLEALWR